MLASVALERLYGGDPEGALTLLGSDPALDMRDVEGLVVRGTILLANHKPAEALSALRLAVASGETAPATVLNLAIAECQAGDQPRGFHLMQAVAERLPQWDEPPLRLAEALRAASRNNEAESAYQQVLRINPSREAALLGLAGLLLLRGDAKTARTLLVCCCGVAPDRADVWDTLGFALLATGDKSLAESAFAKALALAPARLDYGLHRVDSACAAKSESALLAWLETASEADPTSPVLATMRGVLLERMGRRPEAVDVMEVAAALAPDTPDIVRLFGELLARSNRLQEAETVLRRACQLSPDDHWIQNTRAAVLFRMHRHAEARREMLVSLERDPNQVSVLCNLANATCCLGLQDEGVALARKAIALAPKDTQPRLVLCNTLPYQEGITGEELRSALEDVSRLLPRATLPPFGNLADPDRPLRVALLSGSLKIHPVGWLTVAGFETLDPTEFSIICLAQNASDDWMARRFRALAREWYDVDVLTDTVLGERARELGIDILIDLGGYGEASRMRACAHRLAPVQIKWVGMQNHSSGLAEMDWILADRWEIPPEFEHFYSERPLRLADGYVCYSPPPYAPDLAPAPALERGYVTFGCFNNLAKVTPKVIELWCKILAEVPTSRLILKTHQLSDQPTAERIHSAFSEQGVVPARVELSGPSGHRTFLAEYNHVDMVLDPFPYSGGLTTCEALWMGVPTVTMPGETFASRHSASHLSNVGLIDWIAADLDNYMQIAVEKAFDLRALNSLRLGLRARTKKSALCDAPKFGRSLGDALRNSWRYWCEQARNVPGRD